MTDEDLPSPFTIVFTDIVDLVGASYRLLRRFSWHLVVVGAVIAAGIALTGLMDLPGPSEKRQILASTSQILATLTTITITVLLVVSQLYAPYHSFRDNILTKETIGYFVILVAGIILPLAILFEPGFRFVSGPPAEAGPFQFTWTHLALIWLVASFASLPLFLAHVQGTQSPNGLIRTARERLIRSVRAAEQHSITSDLRIISHVGMIAADRHDAALTEYAFRALNEAALEADMQSSDRHAERARLVRDRLWMVPARPGETDQWRECITEVARLNLITKEVGEVGLIFAKCDFLRRFGEKAIQSPTAFVTPLAVADMLAEAMEHSARQQWDQACIASLVQLDQLSQLALLTGAQRTGGAPWKREYLLNSVRRTVRAIDTLFDEAADSKVSDVVILTAIKSLTRICRSVMRDQVPGADGEEILDEEALQARARVWLDSLDGRGKQGLVATTKEVLEILARWQVSLNDAGKTTAGEAASNASYLGHMSASLSWRPAAEQAIRVLQGVAEQALDALATSSSNNRAKEKLVNATTALWSLGWIATRSESPSGLLVFRAMAASARVYRLAVDRGLEEVAVAGILTRDLASLANSCARSGMEFPSSKVAQRLVNDLEKVSACRDDSLREKSARALAAVRRWDAAVKIRADLS